MIKRVAAVMMVLGVLAAGCGGDDEAGSGGTLADADAVRSEQARGSTELAFGEGGDVGGLTVTVEGVSMGGDDGGPWLVADVTVENRTDADVQGLAMAIVCAGSDEEGGWQAGSTLDLNAVFPAQTADSGTVHLLVPGDGRFGEPRPVCEPPAAIVAQPWTAPAEPVAWPIGPAVVDEFNAAPPPG